MDLNKEIETLKEYRKEVLKDGRKVIESLFKAGIIDKQGNLTENYR